ncbi:MAG: hypothetical protein QOG33_490 [Gaiellales bacterium]|nr:hypothetical protein [Gaiellales bacterium]
MVPVAGGWGTPVTLAAVVVAYGAFELSEPGRNMLAVGVRLVIATALATVAQLGLRQAARHSDRVRRLASGVDAAVLELDGSGRISSRNDRAQLLFGGDSGTLSDVIHPDDRGSLAAFNQQLREEGSAELDHRTLSPDGSVVWLHTKASAQRDRRGRLHRVYLISFDVTDALRSSERIRLSEQMHRALVEHVPVVSYRIEAARRALDYVSPQLEAVFGHSSEQWLAAGLWHDWVHPDDRERVVEEWRAHIDDPRPLNLEYRLITGDHRVVWVSDRDQPIYDDEQRVVARQGVLLDITERRAAEVSLRRSEHGFRLLADHAPIGIFRTDPLGWYRYANKTACAIAGTSAEQIRQQGWGPTIHQDDRERVLGAWEAAAADPQQIELAYRFVRPDGELRWVETRAVPMWDGDGGLVGYQGTITDITDRRHAEQALRVSERRFRMLADNAPVGIFQVDPVRDTCYANPRVLEILGTTSEQFDVAGMTQFIHPDDRDAIVEAWERTADTPAGFDAEYRIASPEDGVRWVRVTAAALPDGGGYQGVMNDVTDSKQADDAVRASEQRLRDVFDTVDLLATITSVDGKIVYINEALAASSGRTPEELIGQDWIETLSADADADVVEYFFAELQAGRIVRHDENSIETQDGEVRLIAWSNTILRNGDGSVFGAASIGQDVTDQRVAEAALRDSEERFRTLSELAPVGIFRTDADGGVLYVNEEWSEITGLTVAQAAGPGWANAVHPDDRERATQEWLRTTTAGEQFSIEFRFRRPDGQVKWVHETAVALLDHLGQVEGYLGTSVDITARLEAERSVVESERLLRTITDNMTDVIFVYGMDRRVQYVTPSIEQLTGFTVAELFERNFLDDVHPDDAAGMRWLWSGLFDGDDYSGAEFRIINRDGTEKWCWSSGSPILDEHGVQIGVQIRDADISGLKRAELRLRESEERARSIIETTSDAYLAADEQGVIVEWNGAAERMFGRDRDEAVGHPLLDLVAADQSQELLAGALQTLSELGEGSTLELVGRHRDAGEFPSELTVWQVLVGGERTVNVFVRDITERKLREEQVTFMAYHDKLTGLPNRAMFEQHLELVLVRARHDGNAAGLLYMDLDCFKQVNDTLGHEAGDELLQQVALRLRQAARSGDLVVRLGGDEFVVVLGDLPADVAATVAAAVAQRVQDAFGTPFVLGGRELTASASIGVALFPDDAAGAKALVTAADTGMYASKRSGRGSTSFAVGSRHAA